MQIVRTIVWVLLLVALLIFSVANWEPLVTVRIWENMVVDTRLPAIVVVSFLLGFVPLWLLHRASLWQAHRRINALETAARAAAQVPVAPPPPLDPNAGFPPIDEHRPANT
ncbi:MAG: hypothetical protein WA842_05505 [Croceibacterium sp.]